MFCVLVHPLDFLWADFWSVWIMFRMNIKRTRMRIGVSYGCCPTLWRTCHKNRICVQPIVWGVMEKIHLIISNVKRFRGIWGIKYIAVIPNISFLTGPVHIWKLGYYFKPLGLYGRFVVQTCEHWGWRVFLTPKSTVNRRHPLWTEPRASPCCYIVHFKRFWSPV